jgi:hypothetical protein
MASNHVLMYCCWVGNIPSNIEKDLIKQYFENVANNFDSFHSINVEYNEKYKSYQCYLNFLNENSMIKSAKYFNGKNYCDKILEAEERKSKRFSISSPNSISKTNQNYSANITIANSKHIIPKTIHMKTRDQSCPAKSKHQTKPRNQSVSPPKQRPKILQSYSDTIIISNSKYLRKSLEKKIKLLNEIYLETVVIKIVSEENYDLICKVDSMNANDFQKVVKLIKTYWKTCYQTHYLENETIWNISQIKAEILKRYADEVQIHFKSSKIGVSSFDKTLLNHAINQIKKCISSSVITRV